ncbi:Acylamidase [Posidoniimonas corsicana]|uniref:Acylamidase n=1 Tax=Posidoniimonas corsicana TaxID=1938618 RepID=A0A5C5VFF2_9BACT|nr:amidase [Posidoniimonas corsicana]TWT36590.1 Acylamidase [Posidoniimonas corsicana]
MDASELARQIRSRSISAVEATRDAIDRIEQANPAINAVVSPAYEKALDHALELERRAQGGEWQGPLHGVPLLVKDLFDFQAGVRNTFGCRAMTGFVPTETCAHVQRLVDAGAVIVGKTNTPEFGHKGVTDNLLYGPTSTPFDLLRNAGGSSGGSAAAVSAGMVTLAQGSDAGGSIRIPAAWCGVVGFKATYGRVPNTGGPNAFGCAAPFLHAGPLAATVRDAALMAQVMSGPHPEDPFSLPDDGMNLPAAVDSDPGALRIAYSPDLGVFAVDPEVRQVVEECVRAVADSGLQVDAPEIRLPLDQDELAELWVRQVGIAYLEMFDAMAAAGADVIKAHPDDIPDQIQRMVDAARLASALDARRDEQRRTQVWQSVQGIFADCDILLTPTVGSLPVENAANGNTLGPAAVDGKPVERSIGWCLTHPFNFTGHPAASVPAGLTTGGLPVGIQVVGKRFADEQVVSICRRIEQSHPWSGDLVRMRSHLLKGPAQAASATGAGS